MLKPSVVILDKASEKAISLIKFLYENSREGEGKWILEGDSTHLKGIIRGWPAEVLLAADPLDVCRERDLKKGEVIFISETKQNKESRSLNFFTLSGEKGRNLGEVDLPYVSVCSSQKKFSSANLRSFWYDLSACYFGPLYEKRTALGLAPWGQQRGMKRAPVYGSLNDVLSCFAEPFTEKMCVPESGTEIHLVLCPNYREDRSGITTQMIGHKLESYTNFLASIINLAPTVKELKFYSLNDESLGVDIFRKIINPKAFHQKLGQELKEMFLAYQAIFVDRLSGLVNRDGVKISLTPIQDSFSDADSWGMEYVKNNPQLLDAVTKKVIANSPAVMGQSHEQVKARTAGDLALSITTAKEIGTGVMLDTNSHKKSYWEPMFPALQEVNPDFSLFLLPAYFSHNLAYC